MEWYLYLAIIGIGILVGFINTVAGSGSLLSLPLLIFLGLDANVANGTNRIGILMQSITAAYTYKKQKIFNWNDSIFVSVPAVIGSIIGAFSAVNIKTQTMEIAIGVVLFLMLILMLIKPERWIKARAEEVNQERKKTVLQFVIFFIIGLYGGFIQAGVGFFLLAGLVLSAGFDLVKANAIKVLIVLLYTPFALGIFMYNHQVDYKLGFILGIGSMFGAWFGAKLSIKKGAKFIHAFLIITISISAIKLVIDNIL
jgi:uncharacterized membrane protein YfcA